MCVCVCHEREREGEQRESTRVHKGICIPLRPFRIPVFEDGMYKLKALSKSEESRSPLLKPLSLQPCLLA